MPERELAALEAEFIRRLTGPGGPSQGRSSELQRVRTTDAIRVFRETLSAAAPRPEVLWGGVFYCWRHHGYCRRPVGPHRQEPKPTSTHQPAEESEMQEAINALARTEVGSDAFLIAVGRVRAYADPTRPPLLDLPDDPTEEDRIATYEAALASGLSDAEAREEGWPSRG